MRRKFLSVVLCVCMMLTMAPFAFAEGDSGDSTNDNVSSGSGTATQAVAQIGNITYSTLSEAIAAAENGKTITLLSNTSGQVKIPANKDITLDLNGKTITHTGTTVYNLGKLTICDSSYGKSGKIISTRNVGVGVGHDSTTTIEYANIEAVEGAVITGYATGATITIKDGKFSASDNAVIAGNGNKTDDNATGNPVRVNPNKINILGGTFIGNIKTTGYIACGIYAPWKDIITVSGGNFTVNNGIGIVARAGQVTVTGGSFTCNGTAQGKVGDKNFDMDAAQSVYFDASDPAYPAYNSETDYIKLLGGTFSSDVTKYVAENYTCIQNKDKYTVKALNDVAVAKIGDILYPTLTKAIEAVPDNGESATTVTLIKDSTEDVTIPANKKVALNLNGKKLTNVSSNTITNNGTLTITGTGTVDNVTHQKAALYNKGTATLEGGTFDRTKENGKTKEQSGNNSWYTIKNVGTMTVKDGVTVQTADNNNSLGKFSSLVSNGYFNTSDFTNNKGIDNPKLTIEGGNFLGGLNTIKNDDRATLTIKNGTFSNYYQAVVQNHNVAEIKGGTFTAASDATSTTFGVDNCGCAENTDLGTLTISGGTFAGATYAVFDRSTQSPNITISAGNFAATKASIAKSTTSNATISVTGGYFTSDPTAYITSGYAAKSSKKADYAYMVDKKENNEVIVKPAVATPNVTLGSDIDDAKQEAVKASAQSVKVPEIANAAAKNVSISSSQAERYIKKANLTSSTGQEVILYVQSFLDVTPTAYNEGNNTYTLDITPKYQIIASTATTADQIKLDAAPDKNAVVVEQATVLNVTEPTQVSLTLPTEFVSNLTTDGVTSRVYVKHIKDNGKTYIYEASLNDNTLTFTNPHGFSEFTVTTTAPVATVNGVGYESLQDAVDAVKDNETINVTGTGLSATVSGNKTFSVTGKPVTLTAASGYNLTKNDNVYTVSRQHSGSSSSGTTTSYNVNVNAATNGAVAADKKTASKGTTVTVTASPSKGYVVDAVKVVDKDGKDVAVTEKDGKYVFTMPASAVTVTGSFKAETPAPVALPFTDVKSGNWFYDAVKYAYAQGLMTGTSATTFAPNGTMNRAMIVTVLYRLEKSPAVTGASKFTDVPAGQWYSDAVAWAAANKIVNGYDETTFGPMNAVTREQMAAILFRYEQVKGLENVTLEENLNRFPDQNKISAYAIPALQWAVGQKIINGNADGTLDPTGTATRAQVAQIFTNLLNK